MEVLMAKKSETLLRETRPTPAWRLALSSLLPFILGLVLVGATFGEERDETGGMGLEALDLAEGALEGPEPEPPIEIPASDGPEADLEVVVEVEAEVEEPEVEEPEVEEPELAVLPADVAMGAPTGTEEAPEVPSVESDRLPSDTAFVRGRLAYLRCGSMADADERCPRDRDLESSTWSALEGANHCGLGAGSADVRLHFSGGPPELRFRDYGESPLELGALQACLAPHVATLRSSLPQSFILSMRFTLR
ncbi:MAG: hypothetical protein ACI9KE_001622 [Polyangiales bacterium]|jgi:hypothetical protein